MKVPFVGGAYEARSKNLDPQTCVNLFPVVDQEGGKETIVLRGAPGASEWFDATVVATPTFDPVSGSEVLSTDTCTISCATSGATIHYTTDGTTPDRDSTEYSAPFAIGAGDTTIKAIAFKAGMLPSAVATATYSQIQVETPTFDPVSGSQVTAITACTISCATEGATIHYTIDGSEPTTESTEYSAPFAIGTAETIKALAAKTGAINSDTGTAAYIDTTLSLEPAIDEDDGYVQSNDSYSNTGGTIQIGYDRNNGHRDHGWLLFSSVGIYQGADIKSASLTMRCWSNAASPNVAAQLHCEAADNASRVESWSDYDGKSKTTAYEEFNPVGTGDLEFDAIDPVQEIVDRAGWESGNAIQILIHDKTATPAGNTYVADFRDKGGAETYSQTIPTLEITFR